MRSELGLLDAGQGADCFFLGQLPLPGGRLGTPELIAERSLSHTHSQALEAL